MILVPQGALAVRRCQDKLYDTGCTLADCGQKCWEKHHDASHQCIPTDPGQTIYACYCFYNCGQN